MLRVYGVDALSGVLALPAPPALPVLGEMYVAALATFEVALVDGGFRQPGDTHFAFLVPERAFEDLDVIKKAGETNLLSDRFIGCSLMVDFSNPVFSSRRSSLNKEALWQSNRSSFVDGPTLLGSGNEVDRCRVKELFQQWPDARNLSIC